MDGSPTETSRPARGKLTVALTLVMAVSVIMPPTIGVLGPFLTEELELSRAHIGLLASVVPLIGGLLSPAAGALVDRFGGRRLAIALLCASGAGLLTLAAAPNLPWLIIASALAGLALATGNSATNQLIATHVAPGEQGVVVGVKQSGVQVAAFVVGAVLPGLSLLIGWRYATSSAAAVAVMALVVTFVMVPADNAPARRRSTGRRQPRADRPQWPAVRWLAGYAFFMGAGSSVVVTYVPLYAFEIVGLSVTAAGAAASLMAATAVAARIGWARIAERAWNTPSTLIALACISVVSLVVMIAAASVPELLWLGVIGLGASAIAWNGVAMLFVVAGSPRGLAGRMTGRIQLAFSLGMFSSPLAFGFAVDLTGGYRIGWIVAAVAAGAAGTLVVLGRAALVPAASGRTEEEAAR